MAVSALFVLCLTNHMPEEILKIFTHNDKMNYSLNSIKTLLHSYPKFLNPLIFGFLSKFPYKYIQSHQSSIISLFRLLISTLIPNSMSFSEFYFFGKCLKELYSKRFNKLILEFTLKEPDEGIKFNRIISYCLVNSIQNGALSLRYVYLDFLDDYLDYLEHIDLKIICFDPIFNVKEINLENHKIFSIFFSILKRIGSSNVVRVFPNLLSVLVKSLHCVDFNGKAFKFYSCIIENSFLEPEKVYTDNISLWIDDWLKPFLYCQDMIEYPNLQPTESFLFSTLKTLLKHYESSVIQNEIIRLFELKEFHPIVFCFLPILTKIFPLIKTQSSLLDLAGHLMIKGPEQLSIMCLKFLCSDSSVNEINVKFLHLYFINQPPSQSQFIRDEVFLVFVNMFSGYKKMNSTITPPLKEFVLMFVKIFVGFVSKTTYYGKLKLSYTILQHMLSVIFDSKNDNLIKDICSVYIQNEFINVWIRGLFGDFDFERDVSLFILKSLLLYNNKSIKYEYLEGLFNKALKLSSDSNVNNEYVVSRIFDLLSILDKMDLQKLYNRVSSESNRDQTIGFILDLFERCLFDIRNDQSKFPTPLPCIISGVTFIFKNATNETQTIFIENVTLKTFELIDSAMPIILNHTPEGFFTDQTFELEGFQQGSRTHMSLVWRSAREALSLLDTSAEFMFKNFESDKNFHANLIKIKSFLLTILTESRHVGLYEVSFNVFQNFCSKAWKNKFLRNDLDNTLSNIHEGLINETKSYKTQLTTRRCAGLPYFYEAIISTQQTLTAKSTVKNLMADFLKIIGTKDSDDYTKRFVVVTNITRHLFQSNTTRKYVLAYISEFLLICLNSISSSNWEIKNTSLLLLSALIQNIFGKQKSNSTLLSLSTFSGHYRQIFNEILNKLIFYSKNYKDNNFDTITCILLIFQRMHLCNSETIINDKFKNITMKIKKAFMYFINHKCFKIRSISSECLSKILTHEESKQFIFECMSLIMTIPKLNFNKIHGQFLTILNIFTAQNSLKYSFKNFVIEIFSETSKNFIKFDIIHKKIKTCQPCLVLFVEIFSYFLHKRDLPESTKDMILNTASTIISVIPTQVGYSNLKPYSKLLNPLTLKNFYKILNICLNDSLLSDQFSQLMDLFYELKIFVPTEHEHEINPKEIFDYSCKNCNPVIQLKTILFLFPNILKKDFEEFSLFVISTIKKAIFNFDTIGRNEDLLRILMKCSGILNQLCYTNYKIISSMDIEDFKIACLVFAFCSHPNNTDQLRLFCCQYLSELFKISYENCEFSYVAITTGCYISFVLMNDEEKCVRDASVKSICDNFLNKFINISYHSEFSVLKKLIFIYKFKLIRSILRILSSDIVLLCEHPVRTLIMILDLEFHNLPINFSDMTKSDSPVIKSTLFKKTEKMNSYFDSINFIDLLTQVYVDDLKNESLAVIDDISEHECLKASKILSNNIQKLFIEWKNAHLFDQVDISSSLLLFMKSYLIFLKISKNSQGSSEIMENFKISLECIKYFSVFEGSIPGLHQVAKSILQLITTF